MFTEPLRASDFRLVTFQASDESTLDDKVNDWLRTQSANKVIYYMMSSHTMAEVDDSLSRSFSITIAFGNKPIQ